MIHKRGNSFEIKKSGVTFTVEFTLDYPDLRKVEEMMIFCGDSPDLSEFLTEEFLDDCERECYKHLPEGNEDDYRQDR